MIIFFKSVISEVCVLFDGICWVLIDVWYFLFDEKGLKSLFFVFWCVFFWIRRCFRLTKLWFTTGRRIFRMKVMCMLSVWWMFKIVCIRFSMVVILLWLFWWIFLVSMIIFISIIVMLFSDLFIEVICVSKRVSFLLFGDWVCCCDNLFILMILCVWWFGWCVNIKRWILLFF